MACDANKALEARAAANYIEREKAAYLAAYSYGYRTSLGVGIAMEEIKASEHWRLGYPNAYGAGFWDGFNQGDADHAAHAAKLVAGFDRATNLTVLASVLVFVGFLLWVGLANG